MNIMILNGKPEQLPNSRRVMLTKEIRKIASRKGNVLTSVMLHKKFPGFYPTYYSEALQKEEAAGRLVSVGRDRYIGAV